jgi:hypothetical protein
MSTADTHPNNDSDSPQLPHPIDRGASQAPEGPRGPAWPTPGPPEEALGPVREDAKTLRLDRITVPRLWEAILRAEGRMDEGGSLLDLIVDELTRQDEVAVPAEELRPGGRVQVKVTRIPDLVCRGVPMECLVALAVRALISGGSSEKPSVRMCSWRPDGTCRVVLGPPGQRPVPVGVI